MPHQLIGLLALASAMGIGRFAFTPVMPLMQQWFGLTLADGGLLAGANYAGYLAGALACLVIGPRPRAAARGGLAAVALLTLAMAATGSFSAWFVLRFLAGMASALVFVGVSSLTVSGWAYSGVGLGIAGAGLAALVVGAAGFDPTTAWLLLGGAALLLAAATWRAFGGASAAAAPPTAGPAAPRLEQVRLVACYGALGLGYILPATFLPAQARSLVPDPALFGWTWPVFGLAAALSTVAAATLLRRVPARRLWAGAQVVMAFGVALAALAPGLASLVVAAVAVGGTFMVITMAGMQEARRVAGAGAPRLIATMTTAFAAGQLAGPLLVTGDSLVRPSLFAAALLVAGAALLWRPLSHVDPKGPRDELPA